MGPLSASDAAIEGSPRLKIPMQLTKFGLLSPVPNSTLVNFWDSF